ncbi:MAG: EAL domain-containing protein, partial [Anaerovorax sp.]
YGFEKGDEILKAVAQMMMKNLKNEHELCARINTDEFVALLEFENYEKFVATCRNFTHDFYVKLGKNLGQSVKFPAGYYVSIAKKDERSDILALFEKATIAHKAAKKNKDVKFIEYNKTLALEVLREKEIESKMENALLQEKFQVYLQAKYSLADETLGGAEALVRWDDENKDLFYPGAFIELFEKNGFIKKLDMYMLKQVCKMMKEWMDKGIEPITVSVNFSRVHLVNRNLVEDICKITDDYGIPRSCIQIELTETAIFDNLMVLQGVILQLHNAGLTIAMDDFGSGYSSLGLLKDLQVDVIKLDRSFFADPKYKTRTKTVVRNVIKMAGELGIVVVAEGVETEDHVLLLKELECDMIQGYYYGKPMPANALNLTGKGIAQIKHEKTPFQFSSIGNISLGRGALGTDMPVFVYRLFQFTMRQALSDIYGEGEMIDAFRQSGKIAGKAFAQEFLDLKLELQEFTVNFKEKFEQSKIGILKIEAIDQRKEKIVLTIEEDVSCSGISVYEIRNQICKYEEGFLQGVFGEYTGREYFAVEVDCWGTGAKLCRFVVSEK